MNVITTNTGELDLNGLNKNTILSRVLIQTTTALDPYLHILRALSFPHDQHSQSQCTLPLSSLAWKSFRKSERSVRFRHGRLCSPGRGALPEPGKTCGSGEVQALGSKGGFADFRGLPKLAKAVERLRSKPQLCSYESTQDCCVCAVYSVLDRKL